MTADTISASDQFERAFYDLRAVEKGYVRYRYGGDFILVGPSGVWLVAEFDHIAKADQLQRALPEILISADHMSVTTLACILECDPIMDSEGVVAHVQYLRARIGI